MIFSYPKEGQLLPLTERVMEAEQQVHQREGAIRKSASALSEGFRDRLASPATLVAAAGAGFLIGQFVDRRASSAAVQPRPLPEPETEAPAKHGVLALLLTLLNLARPMVTTYVEEKLKQHVHSSDRQRSEAHT